MAVNLTPQYLEAEQEYKKAQTAEDRLAALKKMWSLVPKHKASEKLQAEIKKKMSDAKEEVEQDKKSPKKGAGLSFKVPRQGAGQIILLGGPNAGKSQRVGLRFTGTDLRTAGAPEPIVPAAASTGGP